MGILLQRLVGEDIELWTLFEANIGRIKADPGQIEQVVLNLVMNARDAMPDGGKLLIEIEKIFLDEEQAIQQGLVPTGHYVLLTVTDNGSGMDEVTQQQIFEPFFTTKATDKGTGLGLSTVNDIVEQAGGNISVDSEVGQGTTFKVFLPCVDEDLPEERNHSGLEEAIYGTETIILADDDSMVRKVVHTTLESYGYQVLAAANGGEATFLAKQYQDTIHLLLTDVVMPEMNGQKLENQLREMFPKMKTLFISGYSDEIMFHHGRLNPEKSYLKKPFNPVALGRRVREVLDT
jgi:two-component system, cell cycle sensor histidine kinase and response regulator CckA